jgi:hypothetical protein
MRGKRQDITLASIKMKGEVWILNPKETSESSLVLA